MKYNFPVLTKVIIKNFSIYKKTNLISVNVKNGVFCLAGANGLGKSTFINIVNYGLTGIVKRPEAEFSQDNSIPKFYSKSKSFATKYFDRRVDENLRDAASISIELTCGDKIFHIERNFFEPDALAKLEIYEEGVNIVDPSGQTSADFDNTYKEVLTKTIGLQDFDQFVFIQTFVLTFDESHQLLFWDNSLMERVLYLFFNLDPSKAKLADQLRKDVSTFESNMRNLQWDATQKQKELTSLINQLESSSTSNPVIDEEIVNQYHELTNSLTEGLDNVQKIESDVKECDLLLADYSLQLSSAKYEYDSLFSESFNQDVSLEKDPAILSILSNIQSDVCGGQDPSQNFEQLKKLIWETKCPGNKASNNALSVKKLQELDELIYKFKGDQDKIQERKQRLLKEYNELRLIVSKFTTQIDEIEKNNENFRLNLYKPSDAQGLASFVNDIKIQIGQLLNNKAEETKKRDEKRLELKNLEKELNSQYLTAEEHFMPIFTEYARNFLGLDINIFLQTYAKGATLILEINDTERREKHQLSESQRYFIDIALRMALIQQSSTQANILIDTPEGSLDIAYESRAGRMFADFAKKGFNLMITANINSSMLLIQLATQCKAEHMQLEKMTEWTTLSEVQQQEQAIIEKAFVEIENHLV
jgi:ABC-type cobalamin/Fe3+-siderophores transport system ATPase subunit